MVNIFVVIVLALFSASISLIIYFIIQNKNKLLSKIERYNQEDSNDTPCTLEINSQTPPVNREPENNKQRPKKCRRVSTEKSRASNDWRLENAPFLPTRIFRRNTFTANG